MNFRDVPNLSKFEQYARLNSEDEIVMDCYKRIREVIAGRLFDLPGNPGARVTVSFGVAGIPTHAIDEAGLVEAADNALYAAKGNGRNRVVADAA